MAEQQSILGRGWAFPVSFKTGKPRDETEKPDSKEYIENNRSYTVELSEEEKDIKESLVILLATSLGERTMRPDFGANMEDMLFESMNVTTASIITNRLKRAILFHEPRVKTNNIDIVPDVAEGRMVVTIEYTIIATNTRTNLVYPYYLDEATNI